MGRLREATFGGPATVLAYLARYTHRAAIANSRLVAISDDEVAFSFKDYRRNGRHKVMRLSPPEFIRRFLLHVLPEGFHRIRHYGFLAKGSRGQKLELCRMLIAAQPLREGANDTAGTGNAEPVTGQSCRDSICQACGGVMRPIAQMPSVKPKPFRCDTS